MTTVVQGLVLLRCWEEVFSVVPWMGWVGWSPVRGNPLDLEEKRGTNELKGLEGVRVARQKRKRKSVRPGVSRGHPTDS